MKYFKNPIVFCLLLLTASISVSAQKDKSKPITFYVYDATAEKENKLFLKLADSIQSVSEKDYLSLETIISSIIHCNPVLSSKNISPGNLWLHSFNDHEEYCKAFSRVVVESGKKIGLNITSVYRGNMIEYKIIGDSISCIYQLGLVPEMLDGENNILFYSIAGNHHPFDKWFTFDPMNKASMKPDTVGNDFLKHAKMASIMMRNRIRLPRELARRISLNLNRLEYMKLFLDILAEKNMKVVHVGKKEIYVESTYAENSPFEMPYRYSIMKDGKIDITSSTAKDIN